MDASPTLDRKQLRAVSTGSIAGNLLGLVHGERGIPERWLERLEVRDVVTEFGRSLDALHAAHAIQGIRSCAGPRSGSFVTAGGTT